MKQFNNDKVIILLGAGASCDTGILNSDQMIENIEDKINEQSWSKYKSLYQYIKSAHYQRRIFLGSTPDNISFNIENLMGLLNIIIDIAKKEIDSYVFVGNWEKDLTPFILDQQDEGLVSSFKEELIKELQTSWLSPDKWIKNSSYYTKLIDFKNSLDGYPLKIFSLNYDLCVEQNLKNEKVEIGFDEQNEWNFRRYDYNDSNKDIGFYLYKIHGSINWEQTGRDKIIKKDTGIKTDNLAIIFGLTNKLQSYDPYLFYSYEFREHCLNTELLVCSGYSFNDTHINDFIKFGFKDKPQKRLIVNIFKDNNEEAKIKKDISSKLEIDEKQIFIYLKKAVDFFNNDLKLEKFALLFDEEKENLPSNF